MSVSTNPSNDTTSMLTMLYSDFEAEHAATRRLLERFPDAKHDWRPHEHSRTLAELATHEEVQVGQPLVPYERFRAS